MIIAAGEEAEVGREYVHARGTILGKVWYTLEEKVALQNTEKIYWGGKKDKSLLIGDVVLNIIQPNIEGTYEKQKTGGNQFAIGDFQLPLAWVEETYKQYETVVKQKTEEEAKKEVEELLKKKQRKW